METLKGISQKHLAEKLGVTQQAVSQWFKSGVVPPARVLQVSKITGVPPEQLNPKTHGSDLVQGTPAAGG